MASRSSMPCRRFGEKLVTRTLPHVSGPARHGTALEIARMSRAKSTGRTAKPYF